MEKVFISSFKKQIKLRQKAMSWKNKGMRKICPVANFHLLLNMIVYLIMEKLLSQKNIYVCVTTELFIF